MFVFVRKRKNILKILTNIIDAKIFLVVFLALIISTVLFTRSALTTVTYNQAVGTYTDDFSDETGLYSKTNAGIDADGKLKLKNSGGGFAAPYELYGAVTTTAIIPTSVVQWGTITINAETPTGTAVRVQVLDDARAPYSDSLLPGNSTGFTGSAIDISGLPVTKIATVPLNAKFGRLTFKIILTTTNASTTPSVDSISLSWTVRQGDVSASSRAATAWSGVLVDGRATSRVAYTANPTYHAIRWKKNIGSSYGGYFARGSGDTIYYKNQGGPSTDGSMMAINRGTGSTTWSTPLSGASYTSPEFTLSANGTIYSSDIFVDMLMAFDGSDGGLKWTYQYSYGHGNTDVAIADDGTLYTIRFGSDSSYITVDAFNPDGSIKWSTTFDPSPTYSHAVSHISLGSDGTIYFSTNISSGSVFQNAGLLYALDPSNGSIKWTYPVGDAGTGVLAPVIGDDGAVYVANGRSTSYPKRITAVWPNGTLKWEYNIGTSTQYWDKMALRSDGILVAERFTAAYSWYPGGTVEFIDTASGSLLSSFPSDSVFTYPRVFFLDSSNGLYKSDISYERSIYESDSACYANFVSTTLSYFDASSTLKWTWSVQPRSFPSNCYASEGGWSGIQGITPPYYFKFFYGMQDEDGRVYIDYNRGYLQYSSSTLFALYPWTLSSAYTPAALPGEQINFTVTTTMQQTNLLTGEANKMQIIIANNSDIVPLTFDSVTSTGDTVWTGSYTLPTSWTTGTYYYRVEASAAGMITDIPVNFASPAAYSSSTGITSTGTISVAAGTAPISLIATPISNNQINLSWSGTGYATFYFAENTYDNSNSGWISVSSHSFTGLSCALTSSFRVQGRNGDSLTTPWSDLVTATTGACPTSAPSPAPASSPAPESTPVTPSSTPTSTTTIIITPTTTVPTPATASTTPTSTQTRVSTPTTTPTSSPQSNETAATTTTTEESEQLSAPTSTPTPALSSSSTNINANSSSTAPESSPSAPSVELCSNAIDDDSDSLTDCADPDCVAYPGCAPSQPTENRGGSPTVECNDSMDNDGDGLTNYPSDPGCESPTDPNEYNPPMAADSSRARRLSIDDLTFTLGKNIVLRAKQQFSILAGNYVSVELSPSAFPKQPKEVEIAVFSELQRYRFASTTGGSYLVTFSAPAIGAHEAYIEVTYVDGEQDSVGFKFESSANGLIVDEDDRPINNAQVSLYSSSGALIEPASLDSVNPHTTNINGTYGWMAPNGQYYLKIEAEGFYSRVTPVFVVDNNVINKTWELIKVPPLLLDVIDAEASFMVNISNISQNVAAKSKATAKRAVQQARIVTDNPTVEKTAVRAAPIAVSIAAAGAIPLISWVDLLPLLRLLFFQPVLLLGKRKRAGWGQIYNSLSKLPLELATVRLFNAKTGSLSQSRVTDNKGRYAFTVEPGEYKLQVQKNNMIFPSALLKNYNSDGRRVDIYHGETIIASENEAVVTVNVPLDPIGEHKTPSRLYWERMGRSVQYGISWVGLVMTAFALLVKPGLYVGALFIIHLFILMLFVRLAVPAKLKSWGIVYDKLDRRPLGQVIARLFNAQFNKLVSTEITNRKGFYHFLAGDSKFYLTYEHKDYEPKKTNTIDLTGKEAEAIAVDVGMVK